MKTPHEFPLRRLLPERVMPKTAGLCAVALVFTCLGCRETHRQLFKRYEDQFAAKRRQFQKVAQILPPAGSVQGTTAANLSPQPVYDAKGESYNTEIVMYDQLLDPDIQSQDHRRLDLLLSGDLLRAIQWTGPKNPMSASALDQGAGDMEQDLKKAVAFRYLVVLRPANFVAPVAVDENTYKPGIADVEGFVVDMDSNKVAGSFRFSAQSESRVEYAYKKGQSQEQRLEDFAHSSLYSDARHKLQPLLERTTGGRFVLDK